MSLSRGWFIQRMKLWSWLGCSQILLSQTRWVWRPSSLSHPSIFCFHFFPSMSSIRSYTGHLISSYSVLFCSFIHPSYYFHLCLHSIPSHPTTIPICLSIAFFLIASHLISPAHSIVPHVIRLFILPSHPILPTYSLHYRSRCSSIGSIMKWNNAVLIGGCTGTLHVLWLYYHSFLYLFSFFHYFPPFI